MTFSDIDKRVIFFELIDKKHADNVKKQIDFLISQEVSKDAMKVFCYGDDEVDSIDFAGVEKLFVPKMCDNTAKFKNFVLMAIKQAGFKGFAYVASDSLEFLKNPNDYMTALENTMIALDYDIHFSTTTDQCNYVFSKFNPRLVIDVDDEDVKQKMHLPDKIFFTSHSNTEFITYNMGAFEVDNVPKFDERFSIAMYMIIEFIARKKATKKPGQLYFMNQYLAIGDEIGVYDNIKSDASQNPENFKAEDAIFKSMNIDYAPDNNIDVVLDAFYAKVKDKTK